MQDADLIISRTLLSDPSLHGGRRGQAPRTVWSVSAFVRPEAYSIATRIGHFVEMRVWMQHVTAMQHYDWRNPGNSPRHIFSNQIVPLRDEKNFYQMHQHDTMMPDGAAATNHAADARKFTG